MRRLLVAALIAALFSGVVVAQKPAPAPPSGPVPKLTDAQMAEVKKQRADGEALHKAGKHQESVDTLAKAMKTLDVK